MQDFQIETDFYKYIRAITEEEYLIVISVKDTIGWNVLAEGYANLKKLGLKLIGSKEDGSYDHWKGYVAIIYKGIVQYENLEERDMTVEYTTVIDGIKLEVCSSPFRSANRASIVVNDEEYAVNRRGMNIVVIDTLDGSVIDSVAFDTWAEGRPCFRNEGKRKIVFAPCRRNKGNLLELNEVRERLKLNNIIENFDYYKKIKVRIFQWAGSQLWSAMESVTMEFARDDRYDLMVIIERKGEDGDKLQKRITSLGIRAVRKEGYSAMQDRPDIAICNHPSILGLAGNSCKLKYLVPVMLINGITYSREESITAIIGNRNYTWNRVFVDRNLFERLEQDEQINSMIELSGNPKFDVIYEKTQVNKKIPEEWEKLKSKKVFVWAFDHNWWLKSCAADLYFKELIQNSLIDMDTGLIIRPHIDFVLEMQRHGVWSNEDINALKYFCKRSSNIVWDDNIDYGPAYSVADAIITDVNCGIIISALPLNKPIAVLQRFDGNRCNPHYPDIVASHYNINSIDDLHSFVEMVKKGEDPRKNIRKEMYEKYVAYFDGLNGKRIKESIEKDIRKYGLKE